MAAGARQRMRQAAAHASGGSACFAGAAPQAKNAMSAATPAPTQFLLRRRRRRQRLLQSGNYNQIVVARIYNNVN